MRVQGPVMAKCRGREASERGEPEGVERNRKEIERREGEIETEEPGQRDEKKRSQIQSREIKGRGRKSEERWK